MVVYSQRRWWRGSSSGSSGSSPQTPKLLTNRALDDLRAIPGVVAVIPRDYMMGGLTIKYHRLEAGANIIGIGTDDLSGLGMEATQGGVELARGTVIIGPNGGQQLLRPETSAPVSRRLRCPISMTSN